LALLKDEGIIHLFGNPGTTELPIMHALKDDPEIICVAAIMKSPSQGVGSGRGSQTIQLGQAISAHLAR
jgi:benzoylformate decarboxylase